MKKLFYIAVAALIVASGFLSSCTESDNDTIQPSGNTDPIERVPS